MARSRLQGSSGLWRLHSLAPRPVNRAAGHLEEQLRQNKSLSEKSFASFVLASQSAMPFKRSLPITSKVVFVFLVRHGCDAPASLHIPDQAALQKAKQLPQAELSQALIIDSRDPSSYTLLSSLIGIILKAAARRLEFAVLCSAIESTRRLGMPGNDRSLEGHMSKLMLLLRSSHPQHS